ncbi:5-methylcytosine restriction system specificity protein McrC [Cellulomonas iranensis]|uniref:5-methylcytosine restriction system specificity protein McrC n=1 Tax=Cellulomonas iranensis TaxID=76862 RepID=UPI0013D3B7DB|nr:hypothetical protein [Cellulomonas iranensis]
MRRHRAREGAVAVELDRAAAAHFHRSLLRLQGELRPTLQFAGGSLAAPRATNLIGTVSLADGSVVDVSPKTTPDDRWISSTIALLEDDRLEASGVRDVRPGQDPDLGSALARVYLRRLATALAREGPLLAIHSHRTRSSMLRGRLDVTQWARSSLLAPHRFPQTVNVMDADNDHTAAMAVVARRLASITRSAQVSSGLRQAALALRPGLPEHMAFDPTRPLPELPPQWRGYAPAWSIVTSVLRRTSILGWRGTGAGVEIAVEPWPLLERLLERALDSAAQLSSVSDRPLVHVQKRKRRLLTPVGSPPESRLAVLHRAAGFTPDGLLALASDHRSVAATFEAKYSRPRGLRGISGHIYQAVAAAAATGARVAVLVYPECSGPVRWEVSGFGGYPAHVIAVGLGMYEYERGTGDLERGELLLDIATAPEQVAEPDESAGLVDLDVTSEDAPHPDA